MKPEIDRRVKPALFGGNILHAIAMCHIHEIERSARDEILQPGSGANVCAQVRQQLVFFRIVQPNSIRHRSIDVDDHDVPPIGRCAIAAWAVDAECRPQEIRQNLRRQRSLGICPDRAAQPQRLDQGLSTLAAGRRQNDAAIFVRSTSCSQPVLAHHPHSTRLRPLIPHLFGVGHARTDTQMRKFVVEDAVAVKIDLLPIEALQKTEFAR